MVIFLRQKIADEDKSLPQCTVTKSILKEEITASNIYVHQCANGDACVRASSVRRSVKHFKYLHKDTADQPPGVHPRTGSTERNKGKIDDLIRDIQRVMVR
jgi:hypothetical protein